MQKYWYKSQESYRSQATKQLVAQYVILKNNYIFDKKGKNYQLKLITGPEAVEKWLSALRNEWGCLS